MEAAANKQDVCTKKNKPVLALKCAQNVSKPAHFNMLEKQVSKSHIQKYANVTYPSLSH